MTDIAQGRRWVLAVHGGAGTIERASLTPEREADFRAGLEAALAAGAAVLDACGSGLDAVEAAVRSLEDEPLFNAGRGAVFTAEGTIELDAAVMDGATLAAGAVIGVTRTRNPVSLARAVMERTAHVVLQGLGADSFALTTGLEQVDPAYFATDWRWQQLQKARQAGAVALDHTAYEERKYGTVGAVALDRSGHLAAATSTGGMTNKMWGRVGDTPLIGAGTYANGTCAVSATGHGEFFIRATVARDVAALMDYAGLTLHEAVERKVQDELVRLGGRGGVIAVDRRGEVALVFNTPGMYRGMQREGGSPLVAIFDDDG
ncbi:isoaspartyl peptidase/L-asparaginase [Chelatococcus sp. SYSU_G07232]|uniref:Isoaspartyl peptidase/L-asparaginase n=1 Tax=Chelatococcus albus TaxID=3047466 RepID=A0ABT7AMQ3_9HYPH|nr:isoaspartyl peptidase/L-asparaginase [Chelatococcus sp. SYSU_G07232]MDJ1160237.1 isoaspartyl peptidase/L-asparaginase [Chelatococcus sp. SYSU_G07232]